MDAKELEIQKEIEERIRIEKLKNIMRACKDKLYEVAAKNNQK